MNRIRIEKMTGEEFETLSAEQASRILGGGINVTLWPGTYSSTVYYGTTTPFVYGPYGAYGYPFAYRPAVVMPTPLYSPFVYGW